MTKHSKLFQIRLGALAQKVFKGIEPKHIPDSWSELKLTEKDYIKWLVQKYDTNELRAKWAVETVEKAMGLDMSEQSIQELESLK